jgi:hypothetical protein
MAVGWATQGDLSFIEEGAAGDRLYLKQGGNVGIGTTDPKCKLDVSGNLRALPTTSNPSAGKGLELTYNSSVDRARILAYDRDASAVKDLEIGGVANCRFPHYSRINSRVIPS